MSEITVADVIDYLEERYPPDWAEAWDRVGFVVGNRSAAVSRVLLAVDSVSEVVEETINGEYELLVTHHPLYLRGTSFVSEDDAKGRMVADLVRAGAGLYCAHTNGDVARGGVADALAERFGLEEVEPLIPGPEAATGTGRIGKVPPQTLRTFAETVAGSLPAGPTGVNVGGDLDATVSVVAVSGGSGDAFLEVARERGADAYVTADLRHHPASEHLLNGPPALICGSHWATEWVWLPHLAEELRAHFGDKLQVDVSTLVTEPWALHLPTEGAAE